MDCPAATAPSTPASAVGPWWVVCLCAQWCGTSRDYRAVFEQLAGALLIADGQAARFLGPLLPQASVLSRLIESLQAGSGGPQADPLAQAVFDRVRASRD